MKERPRFGKKYANYVKDDNLEPFVIHPDIEYATQNYDGTSRTFDDMKLDRSEMVAHDEEFWDGDHDLEMKQTAEERTLNAICRGWRYPRAGEK